MLRTDSKSNSMLKNSKNIIKANLQAKLLRSTSAEPYGSEDIENYEGGEELTLREVLRLKEALKKDGYTEEQIDTILNYIAALINEYPGKD